MSYEWKLSVTSRSYVLSKVTKTPFDTPARPMYWDSYYPVGRLRKVKNKISCKKFVVDRFVSEGKWEYVTLLCMKLDEAKLVAQTLLCSGGQHD